MRELGLYSFIILFLIACTSSPRKGTSPKDEETFSPENDIPAPADEKKEANIHIVEIRQMKFEPAEIKVHKGDQVRWLNKDITDHDITEQTSKAWASSPLSSGESWSMVVTESADYYCNLHQVMKGKITVE